MMYVCYVPVLRSFLKRIGGGGGGEKLKLKNTIFVE
jgi:hypothetical protein